MTVRSSTPEALTISSDPATTSTTAVAAPVVEVESSPAQSLQEVASTSSAASTQDLEVLELRAQAAEAAAAAAAARLQVAEARSSRANSRATSTRASRAPSEVGDESSAHGEPERFHIGDESDTHHAIIDHGDVVLPIAEPTPSPGRVDRLLDFWNSFSNNVMSMNNQRRRALIRTLGTRRLLSFKPS